MGRRRFFGAIVSALVFGAGLIAVSAAPATAATATQLRRYPYLSDAVGTSMTVSWATDRSATTGSVKWGAVAGNGTCTPSTAVAAARTSITVNGVSEYQWTAVVNLPAAGRYCYRPFLTTTDLLGTDLSPQFNTQVPAGSAQPYSFAVIGDWGQTDASGNTVDDTNLVGQIANSGAQFAVSVGDNGYPSGSQTNYGDLQQHGKDISAIFGPTLWTIPGRSMPMFTSSGNHGISSTTASRSTEQVNWPETTAASTSGGRYTMDTYCCVNGTASSQYPSSWYAFNAGNARFYVLQAAWADGNLGTGSVYANDYAAHWAPGTPERTWLEADLAAHPGGMKFAFFHYPMYSDQKAQNSDTFLRGASSLEGLLAANGVKLGFSGHAHIYERNVPGTAGTFPNYITGGGGGTLQPVGENPCQAFDKFAIGWSPSKSKGSKCGSATAPDAATRVYHFIKVSVNGSTVTVTPTDELGRTFDVQTYDFSGTVAPDTVIDSGPAPLTNATSASIAFHSSLPGATFQCKLDAAAASACTSPAALSGLAAGAHTFSVTATVNGVPDPTPATTSWTIDTIAPAAPSGLTATPNTTSVTLSWSAASDPSGIAGYDVVRNGATIGSTTGTGYVDGTVAPSTTYSYQVIARDGAGNASAPSTAVQATTPGTSAPIFTDGFESGSLSAWSSSSGLVVETTTVHGGTHAAEGNTTAGATYAKKIMPSTYTDAYSRTWFNVQSSASQVNLLRHRTAGDVSLAYVFVTATGQLELRNDVAATTTASSIVVAPGSGWHEVELHTVINGTSSVIEVWLDGVRVDALSTTTANLGTTAVNKMQIGEVQSGRTYDVAFDDAAFGTSRVQ